LKKLEDKIFYPFLVIILFWFIVVVFASCSSQYYVSTSNYDPLYGPDEVVLNVPSDVTIDTLSYSQFKRKLRNDFSFRYDFAQYAIDQPYSWYMSNYSFNYWRPFTSFDMYWNRHNLWMDWAFNYPFFNYGWNYGYGWNTYNYGWYSWNRPYRPWNHWNSWFNGPFNIPGHNVVWNSGRENIAYINGPRGSRGIPNNNIEDNIVTRYNKGRNSRIIDNSNENSTLNTIVSNLRDKFTNIRIYNNPNNVPENAGRPIINNNNNNKPIRGSWRPSNNSNNNNSYKPVYNNSNISNSSSRIYTRPTGNSSNSSTGTSSNASKNGGSSRGGNSNRGN
jgi:hypothetical protein